LALIKDSFKKFKLLYPYLLESDLIEYYSVFGGLEDTYRFNFITNSRQDIILDLAQNDFASKYYPFFIFDEPFRRVLITIANGNKKYFSILNKNSIGTNFGEEIFFELIDNGILFKVNSKEKPLKMYQKQKLKKEFRDYKIEPKLFFKDPFLRFWFAFVEPFKKINGIDNSALIENFNKNSIKLYSLVFEQLSTIYLHKFFKNRGVEISCTSFWDVYSEYDIYCKSSDNKFIVGECKYSNRVVTKSEYIKLMYKIEQSNLKGDYIAFFAKSGYSKELEKLKSDRLMLFTLKDVIGF